MQTICTYFLLFLMYAVAGWCLEVLCKLVSERKFINRGFLVGPYCPIYGFGALFITIFLKKYLSDPFTLFIMIILVCSFLEYLTSYALEKLFQTRWWDYSNYRFHINGRICFETMIPFGLFGLFIMYVSNPFFFHLLKHLSPIFLYVLAIIFFFVMTIDIIFSYRIMSSLKKISLNIRTDSTEKITQLVKKEIRKHNKLLQKRLLKAFPKLEVLYSKGIEKQKRKQQIKK